MIAPVDPEPASNSAVPITEFLPDTAKESLQEKVIIIVGMSSVDKPSRTKQNPAHAYHLSSRSDDH